MQYFSSSTFCFSRNKNLFIVTYTSMRKPLFRPPPPPPPQGLHDTGGWKWAAILDLFRHMWLASTHVTKKKKGWGKKKNLLNWGCSHSPSLGHLRSLRTDFAVCVCTSTKSSWISFREVFFFHPESWLNLYEALHLFNVGEEVGKGNKRGWSHFPPRGRGEE